MPGPLQLELLREGLHLLLDPVFYQQLEAAAGVWKVIADEDLLAGLPGWKRETTGTRVTPRLPTVEKGLEKAGFLRAKQALTPTTSQAAAAKQTSRWTHCSSGRAVLRAIIHAIFSLKVAFLSDLWLSISLIRNCQIKTPELII